MITENLTDQEKALLANVPEDGSSVGNVKLIRTLAWPDAQYWEVRDRLLEKGILTTGRGRGGSVRRIVTREIPSESGTEASIESLAGDEEFSQLAESSLYRPVADVLAEN